MKVLSVRIFWPNDEPLLSNNDKHNTTFLRQNPRFFDISDFFLVTRKFRRFVKITHFVAISDLKMVIFIGFDAFYDSTYRTI